MFRITTHDADWLVVSKRYLGDLQSLPAERLSHTDALVTVRQHATFLPRFDRTSTDSWYEFADVGQQPWPFCIADEEWSWIKGSSCMISLPKLLEEM